MVARAGVATSSGDAAGPPARHAITQATAPTSAVTSSGRITTGGPSSSLASPARTGGRGLGRSVQGDPRRRSGKAEGQRDRRPKDERRSGGDRRIDPELDEE